MISPPWTLVTVWLEGVCVLDRGSDKEKQTIKQHGSGGNDVKANNNFLLVPSL